jgi:hypothetical protein
MEKFQILSSFKAANITDESSPDHVFYKVEDEDIALAEKKLGFLLPKELVSFYNEIGYGFMNKGNGAFNRLVDPYSLAQIALKEDFYEGDPDLEVYDDLYNNDKLLFLEVNEGIYLAIDKADEACKNKIYYFDKKIFDSLEDFIKEFVKNPELTREIEY